MNNFPSPKNNRTGFTLIEVMIAIALFTIIMTIGVGSDHAGFKYKEGIKRFLTNLGHNVEDFGTNSERPVDYPLFIRPVALAVASGKVERGIVLGGSGNGEAMVANRLKGEPFKRHSLRALLEP